MRIRGPPRPGLAPSSIHADPFTQCNHPPSTSAHLLASRPGQTPPGTLWSPSLSYPRWGWAAASSALKTVPARPAGNQNRLSSYQILVGVCTLDCCRNSCRGEGSGGATSNYRGTSNKDKMIRRRVHVTAPGQWMDVSPPPPSTTTTTAAPPQIHSHTHMNTTTGTTMKRSSTDLVHNSGCSLKPLALLIVDMMIAY